MEVDTESDERAEGGLACADRSDREVEVLDSESTLGCLEEDRFDPRLSILPLFSILSLKTNPRIPSQVRADGN